jgi:hypothetical protein
MLYEKEMADRLTEIWDTRVPWALNMEKEILVHRLHKPCSCLVEGIGTPVRQADLVSICGTLYHEAMSACKY